MNTKALIACSAAALMAASPALAQSSGAIIDRNRPDRAPTGARAPAPQVPPPAAAPATAAPRTPFAPFVLREVRVEGSSAPAGLIGAASRPFIGKTIDAAGLNAVAQAVAAVYARSDVALYTVVVPDQDFSGGVLRLRAIEGYVTEVVMHVAGGKKSTALIQRYARKLTTERPLRRSTLERYLSLIRDVPGLTVQADFLGAGQPGAVKLALEGQQKTVHFGAAVNNRGTELLGRTQATLDLDLYGSFRGGDHTDFTVAFPTDIDRFQYVSVSHSQLVGSEGMTLSANIGHLRTRPKSVPLTGDATLAGFQAAYPLIRRYDRSLYVSAGIDGLNSDNALLGQTLADERTRALRTAIAYGRTGPRTSYSAAATTSIGLGGLGARIRDVRGAQTEFRKVNGRAALDQAVGRTLVLRLRAAGQYSGDRLPASELFSLGGDPYGRAFQSATATGDYGYAGSAELGWIVKPVPAALKGSEIYGFLDGGKTWLRVPAGPAIGFGLSSAGVGVRLAAAQKAAVQVEAARTLGRPTLVPSNDGWRVMVSLRSLI